MPSGLHKLPDGLLGAFNLKTTGQAPDEFGSMLVPVADVLDFYLRDLLGNSVTAGSVTAAGDSTSTTVPAGVMWRVLSIGLAIQPDAADAALLPYGRFDMRTELMTSPVYLHTCGPGPAMGAAARNINFAVLMPVPLLAKAGTVIAFRNETVYSAAAVTSLNVQFQAIPL